MENYFIIHGSFGSPFGNWFSWLQDFIATDGKQVYVPDFPIGVGYQNYENWSKLLKYYLDLGLINENTTIIIPEELLTKLLRKGINKNAIITVEPNEKYMVQGIKFETIPAYNTNKTFHPKENGWVGYIITLDDIRYYIAGDTDITEENRKVKCDVAFVPVGGTYTMDFKEAAQLINEIQPKIAVPIHYGSVVGTKQDATDFIKLLHPSIKGIILMKQ